MVGFKGMGFGFSRGPQTASEPAPVGSNRAAPAEGATQISSGTSSPSLPPSSVDAAVLGAQLGTAAPAERTSSGLAQRVQSLFRRLAVPVAGVVLGAMLLAGSPTQGAPLQVPQSPAGIEVVDAERTTPERGEMPVAEPRLIEVQAGDELGLIADRYGVGVDALLALNPEIEDPDLIFEGQKIRVPPAEAEALDEAVHIIRADESFDGVAQLHGLSRAELWALNPSVDDPEVVVPGQRLRVKPENEVSTGPREVDVRPGDSFERIAARENRTVPELKRWNPTLASQRYIHPGDIVRLGPLNPPLVEQDATRMEVPRVELPNVPAPVGEGMPTEELMELLAPEAPDAPAVSWSPPDLDPAALPVIRPGVADAESTQVAQDALVGLGFLDPAKADGVVGSATVTAVAALQYERGLGVDGVVGLQTWTSLLDPAGPPARADRSRSYRPGDVFPPRSDALTELFEEAASLAGVDTSWASSEALHRLVELESKGEVGLPNYTYGARRHSVRGMVGVHNELRRGRIRANSSATGIGQLILANVERHYPSGRDGIGVPLEEAAGMLGYIQERYGTPEKALSLYGVLHEGY